MSNSNLTMTQTGNGVAFGMPASGAYAQSVVEIPCSAATGAVIDGATPKRAADVAFEHHPGTPVWSPPT